MRKDDGSVDIRKLVRAFADEAVYQVHEFNEFRTLYYSSEKRIDLLNVTAKNFFSDLFYLFLDRIVLNVSRLTDRQWAGRNERLSLEALHIRCSTHGDYPVEPAGALVAQMRAIGADLKRWRHKRAAHLDLRVALDLDEIGTEFVPSRIQEFYDLVQQYVTLVYEHLFHDVFELRTVAFYGAEDLIRALKDAHALRRVLKRDPLAYDRLLRDSGFADA